MASCFQHINECLYVVKSQLRSHWAFLGTVKQEIWVLRVLTEHDNKGKLGRWKLHLNARPHPDFDGNVLIKDVVISKRAA